MSAIGWSIGGSSIAHRGRGPEAPSSGHRSIAILYLRDLCTVGEVGARIGRFHERVETIDGIPLQVLENTATAGDVILMHPLLLHAPPTTTSGPRRAFC